jgi:hypothetical protein
LKSKTDPRQAEKAVSTEALLSLSAELWYALGSFHEVLVLWWQETWRFILPLLLWVLPRTIGVMLLGIAAWRAGILRRPDEHRRLLVAITLGAGGLGGLATSLAVFAKSCGRGHAPSA